MRKSKLENSLSAATSPGPPQRPKSPKLPKPSKLPQSPQSPKPPQSPQSPQSQSSPNLPKSLKSARPPGSPAAPKPSAAPPAAPSPAAAAAPPPPGTTYTIADLAREFDITPRAIRFYEDHAIMQPLRTGRGGLKRVYSNRDRTRLKLTLRGKRLGLTLTQVRELIDMYESPKDAVAQARSFLEVLAQHRAALEQQREDIEITLAEIAQHEAQCRKMLQGR